MCVQLFVLAGVFAQLSARSKNFNKLVVRPQGEIVIFQFRSCKTKLSKLLTCAKLWYYQYKVKYFKYKIPLQNVKILGFSSIFPNKTYNYS